MSPITIEHTGFVDLQVNGFAGIDFNDPGCTPDDLQRALDAIVRTGVTRCLPTLITSSLDRFTACARLIARHPSRVIAGLHMEGPYISPADGARGAHPLEHVAPASRDDFERRQEAAEGRIVLVTLAPEVPGALALIEHLSAAGIRVALGHTVAEPQQIADAVRAGATLSTHLGNGCPLTLPRHPNVIWEQLAADALVASLIVDGHHLPPSTVKVMVRAKSPERTILVTDAVAPAASPPGQYWVSGMRIELDANGRVSKPGSRMLAGSALLMPQAIGNVVRFTDLAIDRVLRMASDQPAAYIGVRPAGRVTMVWDADEHRLTVERVTQMDTNESDPQIHTDEHR
ncbi:MAG: N-acetylglucosamine-6-phosphate deacetylase [Luteitalea sp.]|nr:N-acetylglucosamine-6-phosphate deacetylase [Luteitalea sp.]